MNTDIDDLDFKERLGVGGTAIIIKAKLKANDLKAKHSVEDIAIKIINEDKISPESLPEMKKSFLYEVTVMSSIPKHDNIVHLIGYAEDPMSIVMKFYPISLRDLIKSTNETICPLIFKIALDVARGVDTIHKHEILHLDIKPRKLSPSSQFY